MLSTLPSRLVILTILIFRYRLNQQMKFYHISSHFDYQRFGFSLLHKQSLENGFLKSLDLVNGFHFFYFWYLHLGQQSSRRYLCNLQSQDPTQKIHLLRSICNGVLQNQDLADPVFVSYKFKWKRLLLNISLSYSENIS